MTQFKVNGKQVTVDEDENSSLLFFLRDQLQLTGTKYGCGVAACGACTVHVDGEAAYACQTLISDLDGAEVTTIEGFLAGLRS